MKINKINKMALFIHLFVNGENTPLEQEAAKLVGGDIGLLVSYQGTENYFELTSRLGVVTPSVAFATNCPNGLYYFGKIIGGTVTMQQMRDALIARLQSPVDCNNVTNDVPLLGSGTNGGELIESNSGLLPGYGAGLNLPKWAWWLVAVASGYKSYSSKKDLGKWGFGLLSAVGLSKAMKGVNGIGEIMDEKPSRGGSQCKDKKWSSYGMEVRGGVCSYHGGRMLQSKSQAKENNETTFTTNNNTYNKTKRLIVLENSLDKKNKEFDKKLNNHFADVKRANGQPLNDKRNGYSTLRRWEKQNDSLRNLQKEIDKTKIAIEREIDKIIGVQLTNNKLPSPIIKLINDGKISQWRKHPNIFFVKGVDKARMQYDEKKGLLYHRYTKEIKDKDQWKLFAQTYNELSKKINNENK